MGRERSPGNEPPLGNAGARYTDPPGREHIRGVMLRGFPQLVDSSLADASVELRAPDTSPGSCWVFQMTTNFR